MIKDESQPENLETAEALEYENLNFMSNQTNDTLIQFCSLYSKTRLSFCKHFQTSHNKTTQFDLSKFLN